MKFSQNIADQISHRKSIFLIILCIIFIPIDSKSQDILTVSEVYNFEINDIFHFEYYGSGAGSWGRTIKNIRIVDKFYNQDNDTLYYIRDIDSKSNNSYNLEWIYEYYNDTIFVADLDSLINFGQIDTAYIDSSLYNGRLINESSEIELPKITSDTYVLGCGNVLYASYWVEHPASEYEERLVYYKKGTEEWGTEFPVSINTPTETESDIEIFPNPCQNILRIKSHKNTTGILRIYSLSGVLKKEIIINARLTTIDVSILNTGIYFLRMNHEDQPIIKKLIKK